MGITEHLQKDRRELIQCWESSPFPSTKLTSYFSAYASLFGHLRGTQCTFVETGVLLGGSLFMWRNWLGDKARIIGIDLNPDAKKWESSGFEIYIGDQGDPQFWRETFQSIGMIDGFLDDGGHQSFQQVVTLESILRHNSSSSVIAIEDTHTSYMADFSAHGEFSFLRYAKDATDLLTARAQEIYPTRFKNVTNLVSAELFSRVYSVQFFGSLVAFHVDEEFSEPPRGVWNRQPSSIKDFRYEGRAEATILWPDPFQENRVTIKGG